MGSFCRKSMIFELKKSTQGFYFMILKIDAKFEGKLTCGLKNGVRDLVNFRQTTQRYGNLHFDGLLLLKLYNVSAKKEQKIYLS